MQISDIDLTALIATQIMGYEHPPYLGAGRVWAPQDDIGQAMQVLRKTRMSINERTETHWIYFRLTAEPEGWTAELWWGTNPTPNYFVVRGIKQAAEAICRVCLAAIDD